MRTTKNSKIPVGVWGLASCFMIGAINAKADSLVVLENPTLIVDSASNTATNWLYLQNISSAPLNVRLSASDFTNTATGKPLGAGVSFDGGTNWVPFMETNGLASNGTWAIRVRAANVWEAGESKAMLLANGVALAPLVAAHWRVPFGVSLAGPAAQTNELAFECGRPVSLVLSNADPMTYEVGWDLAIGGNTVMSGRAVLLPSSQAMAGNVPKDKVFCGGRFSIKDQSQDAQLTLQWKPPPQAGGAPLREKNISVRFRSAGSTPAQYAMILLCLVAGVAGSWALHITLPNLRRRADLGSQLDHLAERTRNLSNHVDSSLRVILRVQRRRLINALMDGFIWSPDTSSTLDEVKANMGTLNHQLALVERMDRVYDRLACMSATPVPTALEAIDAGLAQASRVLRATTPTDEDLQSAETLMKDIEARLARLGQADDALVSLIAQRIKMVRTQLTDSVLNGPDGQSASKRLPALLGQLAPGQPAVVQPAFDAKFEDPRNITPDLYPQLDVKSRKLELVVQYFQALGNLAEETRKSAALQERMNKLMGLLELEGYTALRQADRLVREMQQGIYPEEIQKELSTPEPGASIELDQSIAYPNAPAQHRLVFRKMEMNAAVAREEFTYEWDFGKEYVEPGQSWTVWHFYPEKGKQEIKVTIWLTEGRPIATLTRTIEVRALPSSHWVKERTWVEGARAGVALLAPLLALVAGAREKVLQQDLFMAVVAIFLMGFTADVVKNLLVQGSTPSTGKPAA